MGENKGTQRHHMWPVWEERYLIITITRLAPMYHGWSKGFYEAIADDMNVHFARQTDHYVPLTTKKIRAKIDE